MNETWMLLLLCLFMLVASYLAGSIPLVISLSEDKLQLVSVFGAGLLVGTALAVIIPEGISSLITSENGLHKANEEGAYVGPDNIHSVIGFSLVFGFVIMLLIDQVSSLHSRGDLEAGYERGPKVTVTVGLVVHSAVDGVALGAAASTAHHDVEMIVFLAIMLHKAPAAFGLVSFLVAEHLDKVRIRRHLLLFSFAAPSLAILTYFFIGQEGKEKLSSMNATGVAMLFSAGTFLYVATVHVLPEVTNRVGTFRPKQLGAFVVGTLFPLFLTMLHSH